MLQNYLNLTKEYYKVREELAKGPHDCGILRVITDENELLIEKEDEIEALFHNIDIDIYNLDIKINNPIVEMFYKYNETKDQLVKTYFNIDYNDCFLQGDNDVVAMEKYIQNVICIKILSIFCNKWIKRFENIKPFMENRLCYDLVNIIIEFMM